MSEDTDNRLFPTKHGHHYTPAFYDTAEQGIWEPHRCNCLGKKNFSFLTRQNNKPESAQMKKNNQKLECGMRANRAQGDDAFQFLFYIL